MGGGVLMHHCTTLHHHSIATGVAPRLHHCTTCTTTFRGGRWWWCGLLGSDAPGLTVTESATWIDGEPGEAWAWGGGSDDNPTSPRGPAPFSFADKIPSYDFGTCGLPSAVRRQPLHHKGLRRS